MPSAAIAAATRSGCPASTWWSKLAMTANRFFPAGAE